MRKLYPWLGLLALAGCKQAPQLPAVISPYKIDIQQGNVVTQEMLAKLKAGMTRAQVRFALGSPLVIDPFRTDRWDYVYSLERQGKNVERRRITVIFDEDKLLRLEGDILPVDPSLISDRPPQPRQQAVPAPAAAPKPEAAKPVEKPTVKAPVAAPPVAKPEAVAKPAEKPAEQPPVAATPAPEAAPPEAAKAEGKTVPAEAKKIDAAKTDTGKEKPKPKGFFGRMLDKIGF